MEAYTQEINWDRLIEEADACGIVFVLYYCFYYSYARLNHYVPVIERLRLCPHGHFNLDKLFVFFLRARLSLYAFSYLAFFLSEQGIKNKARFIAKTIFPPPQVMAHICGIPLAQVNPYSYFKRIISLFIKL